MTKVKICGITNLEDAQLSTKFGADALGFNFYEKSPRYILPEDARKIIDELPEEILNVGVFVNEDLDKIIEIAKTANINAIQLHGEETPEFAKELKKKTGLEIIKAFRVSPEFQPEDVLQYDVDAILLDAYSPKEHGGTGGTFDWEIAKKVKEFFPRLYLAGGLNHENILSSIARTEPFFVDVCSGIESEKGKKDLIELINFITKVKNRNNFTIDFYDSTRNTPNLICGPIDKRVYRNPQNIYELLVKIHARPEMVLSMKSLSKLYMFLCGFKSALLIINSIEFFGNFGGNEYQKWMGKKVGYGYPNTIDCMTHILRKFDNDEEKAFDYYFALLEEFKLEHGIK